MNNKMVGLFLACLMLLSGLLMVSRSQAEEINSYTYLPVVIKNYPIIETGKIVFVYEQEGITGGEIYTMNADGSNVTRLTNNSSVDSGPDWSPDGSKIAFQSDQTGEFEIWTMNSNGTNPTQITTLTHCYQPQWSPDGTRIAFYTRQDNNNIIYTMNPDGSGLVQVTDPAVSAYDPYWSPDGTRIAYTTAQGTPGVYAVNPDGTNTTALLESTGIAYFAWSPDGKYLALSMTTPDWNFDIYLLELANSNLTRITNTQKNHNSIDWSPGGNFLIFHSNLIDFSNWDIYTISVSRHTLTDISNLPGAEGEPDWIR